MSAIGSRPLRPECHRDDFAGLQVFYRDIKAVAIASAEFLKSRNPNSNIAMKDLRTGEVTPVAFRPQRA